jgi:hypothetical protein
MIWGAHKADGRIAAKNSVKIRAAIRRSIDARQIFEAYQDTQPFVTDNNVQDRARARAWAMLHVQVDTAPIKAALLKIWADGFVLGTDSATEAVAKARLATKAGDTYIDWANWTPGNRAAALLLSPTGAFEKLLADANITSNAIAKVGYDRIGTALADSIAAGFSPQKAARVMLDKVGDPARALTIAITEQNRAMSLATVQTYKDFGLEKVEWSGANPCDICAPNEGQVVTLGDEFESGDTEPPVHPNCRCALLPVIAGMEDDPSLGQNYLDIDELANSIYDRAAANEPSVTDLMDSIASGLNANLSGLENKLKTVSSLRDKIELVAKEDFGGNFNLAAQNIRDSLRYTMVAESSQYAKTINSAVNTLRDQGYTATVKNYWKDGSVYKGVNVALTSPSGTLLELQFHTPQSLAVKGKIHPLYEDYRVLNPASAAAAELEQKMIDISNTLQLPKNVTSVL